MTLKLRHEFSSWLTKPPYDGVIWLAWFYVIGVCFYVGGGPFTGDLTWFDDRVRLVQILNWLNGANWYDRTITRVNAPEGFHTIWSRVVDLPAAGIITALQPFLGQMRAAMVASIVIPLAETMLLFQAAVYFTRPLIGDRNAKLVTLFVLFTSALNPEPFTSAGFQLGMLSHHSWYVLLILMVWGSTARLLLGSDRNAVIIGGCSVAGLLVVGIEGFPLIAGASALLAFVAWLHNRPALARDISYLMLIGAVLGLLALPANQPPDHWLTASFAEPSIFGPILISTAALFFAGEFFFLRQWGRKKYFTFTAIAALALLLAAALIGAFPALLNGAAAALSPEERKLAATEHWEALSIFVLSRGKIDTLRMIMPPLLAALSASYGIAKTKNRPQQALFIFHLGLVALTFTLSASFSRFYHYLGLAVSPLLLFGWLTATQGIKRDTSFALKSFGLYVFLGPLWLWLVPAAYHNMEFGTKVLAFPARMQMTVNPCDARQVTEFLDLRYGGDKTIIVPMYSSDSFLLHTRLKIFFLANFPSGNKFIDAKAFYETGSPEKARSIITSHNIDLVAICTKAYTVTPQSTFTNQLLKGHMSFGQLLVTGQAPDWLEPVLIAAPTPWLVFEVNHGKAAR